MSELTDYKVSLSEARGAWIVAFTKARKEFPAIGKDTTVDTGRYSYSYATLPDIIAKVTDVLRGNGFVISQDVTGDGQTIAVETRVYHKAGWVEKFGPLALKVSGDAQSAGSAITYARRYALCAALGIAPDEDDDGAQASKPARSEPVEVSPWVNLWNEAAIFKTWDTDRRAEAIQVAVDALAITSGDAMSKDEADRVFSHLKGQYETSEQETLPV